MSIGSTPPARRSGPSRLARLSSLGASVVLGLALGLTPGLPTPAAGAPTLGPAAATDSGPDGDPRTTITRAYLAAYPDLTPDQAGAAAALQARIGPLKAALTADPDHFAGGWIDPYHGVVHAAVTSPAAARQAAALADQFGLPLRTHLVTHSLAELLQLADQLRAGPVGQAAGDQIGLDLRTNQVVVAVPATALPQLSRAHLPPAVRLETAAAPAVEPDVCHSRRDCDDSLRAGLVLRRDGATFCSAGFTATDSKGYHWLLTAGHCAGLGQTWSTGTTQQTVIGPMTDAIDSGPVDAGAIRIDHTGYVDQVGRIYMHNDPGRWIKVDGAVRSMADIWEGETVCLSARYTDPTAPTNPCGVITAVSDPQVRGMVKVQGYDACNGDSGGGWYLLTGDRQRHAYGLHSRSSSGCNAAEATSWFSPLPSFWTGLTYWLG